MIKFFRKIRQDLISEGQTRKYIKYAIGEIILVVIGILIALQINNWNENRKVLKAQKNLLENFYDNLGVDSVQLAIDKQAMLEILACQKQLHAFRKGIIKSNLVDNPVKIRGSIRNVSITQANHPDIAAKVLNEAIKEEIRVYYRLLASMGNAYKQYDNVVKESIRPYLSENLALNADIIFDNRAQLETVQTLNLENFYRAVKEDYFSQLLFESNLKAVELVAFFDRVISANYALRLTIKNELNGRDK
jgi:hypothetical protein